MQQSGGGGCGHLFPSRVQRRPLRHYGDNGNRIPHVVAGRLLASTLSRANLESRERESVVHDRSLRHGGFADCGLWVLDDSLLSVDLMPVRYYSCSVTSSTNFKTGLLCAIVLAWAGVPIPWYK